MHNHFTILITAYNCENWAEKNLNSAIQQKYDNFDVVYVDDNSSDKTWEIISSYKRCENLKLIRNVFNKGKMYNMYEAIRDIQNEDTIVVILDGDDWLIDENVLSCLNETYKADNIWMTNGSYVIEPTKEVVRPLIDKNYWQGAIRKKSWQFSHLGTFRKKLFCKIKRKDFMNKQSLFWETTSDQAIMWPMAEMAGPEHFKSIDKVLYVYNRLNALSDDRVNRIDQLKTEQIIRNKNSYERLRNL